MEIFNENYLIMTYTDQFVFEFLEFIKWGKWMFIAALFLTLADLKFGIAASKKRKESVKRSRAVRRTVDKIVSYILWVIVAYTFGKAFSMPFGIDILPVIILIVIYGVELESIYVNYFASKGKNIKVNVFKLFKSKTDIIDIEEKDNE